MTEKLFGTEKTSTSPKFSMNGYDWWSVLVQGLLIGVGAMITWAIGNVTGWITVENVGPMAPMVLTVITAVLNAARKFLKDYTNTPDQV